MVYCRTLPDLTFPMTEWDLGTRLVLSLIFFSVDKWSSVPDGEWVWSVLWERALTQAQCIDHFEKNSYWIGFSLIWFFFIYWIVSIRTCFLCSLSRCYTLKLLAETCVQRRCEKVSQSDVTRWNSRFCHHCDRCDRCRSRKRFYFWWNLSRNRSSKSFTKPTMLHGATPAETCFATPLHTSFS